MISSAADYRFVDFQRGDLPTEQFNGKIMPLRQDGGGGSDFPEEMLKAEDIAFLAECVRDKAGAFAGLKVLDVDVGFSPQKFVPTKRLSSSQMLNLRSYLANQLSVGFPVSSVGYLKQAMTEIAAYDISANLDSEGKMNNMLAAVASTCGGIWTPTTAAADFERGARVLSAPVAAMFDDAKHLIIPAVRKRFGFS